MGLSGNDLARVSAANKLYEFLAVIVEHAVQKGFIVVVENPRSSLFWRTRFWKRVSQHFQYFAHQACAYGGSRAKWTVLASNHPAFQKITLSCPGVSQNHVHKPWGLVRTEQGTHFSTSEETAYLHPLAYAIARVFADILFHHGWSPPEEYFQPAADSSLQTMRAVATSQPKAARIPPVVQEHKQVVLVRGPHEILTSIAVQSMQRLKSPLEIPSGCFSAVQVLPEGSQLLRCTPIRLNGESSGAQQVDISEQAWGIPFTPDEFIQVAISRGHPKSFVSLLPAVLEEAVQQNFSGKDLGSLATLRTDWFSKWTARAKLLVQDEAN